MLRKTFVFCIFLLSLFALSSFIKNVTYAALCNLHVIVGGNEVKELNSDFKGKFDIVSDTACFNNEKVNYIIICPNIEGENEDMDKCRQAGTLERDVVYGNNTTLRYVGWSDDFLPGARNFYPNQKGWLFKACEVQRATDIPSRDCAANNPNVIGIKGINAAPVVGPPAPVEDDSIPMVDRNAQTQCIYRTKDVVTINKIKGLKPNTKYEWWWNGDFRGNGIKAAIANNTEIINFREFEPKHVDKLGRQTFCVDIEGRGMRGCAKADARNGVTLKFEKGALPADVSCKDLKADDSHPAPPCLQWLDINGKPLSPNDPRIDKADGIKKCASVDTAIGPINTNPSDFVRKLLAIILSISGGIALLLIIFSGYKIMTSQGNPEKLQGARETLTSAIVGLLLIIFSLVIIELIGVDILRLPGFSR